MKTLPPPRYGGVDRVRNLAYVLLVCFVVAFGFLAATWVGLAKPEPGLDVFVGVCGLAALVALAMLKWPERFVKPFDGK